MPNLWLILSKNKTKTCSIRTVLDLLAKIRKKLLNLSKKSPKISWYWSCNPNNLFWMENISLKISPKFSYISTKIYPKDMKNLKITRTLFLKSKFNLEFILVWIAKMLKRKTNWSKNSNQTPTRSLESKKTWWPFWWI